MDLYFNELSVKRAGSREIARQWIKAMVGIYKRAGEMGFEGIRVTGNLLEEFIADDYNVGQWLHDSKVDREIRLLFKTQFLKYPFIDDVLDQESSDGNKLYEFKYKDKMARGLGAAYLFDSAAISFDSDIQWDTIRIPLRIVSYSEEKASLDETDGVVRHVSKPVHLDQLEKWVTETKKRSIKNGKILWLKRRGLFPHLDFCENVEDQMSSLRKNDPGFIQVIKKLFELENYFSRWKKGPFNADELPTKATPESETRLNKLERQLTIRCEDRKPRLFSWHLRFTHVPGRIYFYPDEKKRRCHIGYIGLKIQ